MTPYKTDGIILRRHDYAEADRIYTIMTPNSKISAIAKGIRRPQAKLASHMELFCDIELMLAPGRNLDILTSAKIKRRRDIAQDYERLRLGFLFLEMSDKLSDTKETAGVYGLLKQAFSALEECDPKVVELAFKLKLLEVLGHAPDLNDLGGVTGGVKPGKSYVFNPASGSLESFAAAGANVLSTDSIKLWRLCLRYDIAKVVKLKGSHAAAETSLLVCDRFYEYLFGRRFLSAEI